MTLKLVICVSANKELRMKELCLAFFSAKVDNSLDGNPPRSKAFIETGVIQSLEVTGITNIVCEWIRGSGMCVCD